MIIFVSVYLIVVWLRNFQRNQMHESNRIAALLIQAACVHVCVWIFVLPHFGPSVHDILSPLSCTLCQ